MANTLKILRRPQVESLTGMSRSSIYAMMADGTFPKPIRLTARAVGWVEDEVQEWLKTRFAASRREVGNEE